MFRIIKRRFLLLWLAFVFSQPHFSQVSGPTPGWVEQVGIDNIGVINQSDVEGGYYYVLLDEQFNTVLKQNYYHYAKKITGEAGLTAVSQVEVSFDPSCQKAQFHTITVHRNGEKLNRINSAESRLLDEEGDRQNNVLTGYKTIYYNLSDLRVGDVLEYSYSVSGRNAVFADHFAYRLGLEYSVPLGRLNFRVITRPDLEPVVVYKHKAPQANIVKGKNKEYRWRLDNPVIKRNNEVVPQWYDAYSNVEITDFQDLKAVKAFCKGLFDLGPYTTTQLRALRDSIVKKYPGDYTQQITAAVDFVQKQIRYSGNEFGVYSHVPHKPDFVLSKRYGDCKDKSNLLVELLKLLSVEAYPALLNTTMRAHVVDLAPSHNLFDHCIVAVRYLSAWYFIDPTITYQSGNFFERKLPDYGAALVLDDSPPAFTEIPADTFSGTDVSEDFEIEDNGNVILTAVFDYHGSPADDVRRTFGTNSKADIQEAYRKVYMKYCNKVDVTDSVGYEDLVTGNRVITREHYMLRDFWKPDSTGDSKVISKSFLPYFLNDKLIYPDEESREHPLVINHPVNVRHKITIKESTGWNVEAKTIKEDNDFFSYTYNMSVEVDKLVLDYSYRSKKGVILPTEYKLFRQKMDFVSNNMVFNSVQKLFRNEAKSFNWVLLLVYIFSATVSVVFCLEFYKKRLNYSYGNEHTSIGGWLVLLALGVVLNPLYLAYDVLNGISDTFKLNYYAHYMSKESHFYDPAKAYWFLTEAAANTLLLTMNVFLIFVFFNRLNTFRLYYTVVKCFHLLVLIVDIAAVGLVFDEAELDNAGAVAIKSNIYKMILGLLIWLPYLWISDRARGTFTVGNTGDDSDNSTGIATAATGITPD